MTSFVPQPQSRRQDTSLQDPTQSFQRTSRISTPLYAEGEEKRTRTKGVYVRPSGAIEKGSGFFFPGLEGPRVRVLFGSVLLVFTAVNHVTSPTPFGGLSFEEVIAILYSLLVLFQAAIEFGKEELIVEGGGSGAAKSTRSDEELVQKWATSSSLNENSKSKIQWAAASYLSITPATQMMLLDGSSSDNQKMVYRLGGESSSSVSPTDESTGIEAALQQLQKSKGGRISLPSTHPAAVALGLTDSRSIILQRVTDTSCWLVTSDQLLASFTQADLKWLGRLAAYVKSA